MLTKILRVKILFVINNIYGVGNGLNASARTTVANLRKAGQEVRVISMKNKDPQGPQPDYIVPSYKFPIFQPLIEAQNYYFAETDYDVLREAISWADVIHVEEPFGLEYRAAVMAAEMKKPCVGTFHLYPENIFCNIKMSWCKTFNHGLMWLWKVFVFDKCSYIQCPTKNVADRLARFKFKAKLPVISNGMTVTGAPVTQDCQTDPYLITCIGRLSNEKDQYTLLHAMKYTKYADKIQLYFAGAGPEEQRIKLIADEFVDRGIIKIKPKFAFHTIDELNELSSKAYLYIHCANVEVEGLSCVEALRQGSVPVIAKAKYSGTPQFALDERSLFRAGNARELAAKIDWWIEHPKEHDEMRPLYSQSVNKYEISKSIEQLIEMYQNAISEARS